MDIYEYLMAKNVDISYNTVKRIVRALERKPKEAFIR